MRAEMKSFAERNRLAIGTVGIVVVAAVALAALQYQRLPFFNQGTRVSAYFADAGGLRTGNTVEVSGYPVGKVSSISLDGPGVLVEFKVDTDVRLGNRTEVAIKTKGLLGSKFLDVTPRGDGRLDSPIPIERTTSPYQLPDALGDLAATISGLHTERLSESLATLAQTFADTPAHFRNAIHGVARLARRADGRYFAKSGSTYWLLVCGLPGCWAAVSPTNLLVGAPYSEDRTNEGTEPCLRHPLQPAKRFPRSAQERGSTPPTGPPFPRCAGSKASTRS